MNMKKLAKEAKEELNEEKKKMAKCIIKNRLSELKRAKKVLKKLEKQYEELLKKDVDEVVDD